jgi:hypothetical protein
VQATGDQVPDVQVARLRNGEVQIVPGSPLRAAALNLRRTLNLGPENGNGTRALT